MTVELLRMVSFIIRTCIQSLAQAHYQHNTVVETLQQALHCINLESMKSERMTVHTIVITPTSGLYRLCRYVSTILLSPTFACVPSCQTWKSSGNKVFILSAR